MIINKILLKYLIFSMLLAGSFAFAQTFVNLVSVTPNNGIIGDGITIRGSNLGVDVDYNCAPYSSGGLRDTRCNVQFHDINYRRSTVSGTETAPDTVTANVPTDLCPGAYTIKVGEVLDSSNTIPFTVSIEPNLRPGCRVIETIVPNNGPRGTTVTLAGRNLHTNVQLYDSRMRMNEVAGSGNATQITFVVPDNQAPGTYSVRVGPDVTDVSNGLDFSVTGDVAGPSIFNVRVVNITETEATITWETDEPATGQVEYCTRFIRCGDNTPLMPSLIRSHAVNLAGLEAGSRYYFWVKSSDGSNNATTYGPMAFRTNSIVYPYISNIRITNTTLDSATITWTTNVPTSSQVEYCDTYLPCGVNTALNNNLVTDHAVTITGLNAGTRYYVWPKSADSNGNSTTSWRRSFRTAYPPYPYIYSIRRTDITLDSATITWSTAVPATGQIEYCTTSTRCGITTPLNNNLATDHTVTITGLSSGTRYYIWILASEAGGYTSESYRSSFRTSYPVYISIADIQSSNVTSTSAIVTWQTNTPGTSQVEYCASSSRCGTLTALDTNMVTSHSVNITGLQPNTRYYFWVSSTDAYNYQANGYTRSFTTLP